MKKKITAPTPVALTWRSGLCDPMTDGALPVDLRSTSYTWIRKVKPYRKGPYKQDPDKRQEKEFHALQLYVDTSKYFR